jgi:hypothetical protein
VEGKENVSLEMSAYPFNEGEGL